MRIGLLFMAVLSTGQLWAQNYPVSDPSNDDGWILNETLSDEFDGSELDKSKWWILGENSDYRHKWKGRAPGQFAGHNVRVENGNLILSSQWEPDFDFANEKNNGVYYGGTASSADNSKPITQACIMSETFFRYGYMEIRCKVADAPVTSSFWTTGYHSEIDMTENFGKRPVGNPENKPLSLERKYRTNLINWDPDRDPDHQNWKVEDDIGVRLAEDYHVYGFEWDKDYIRTYFDGKLVRVVTRAELEANDQWRHQYPQELWIDSEVFSWYGLPSEVDLSNPGEYLIDYVRIWQKKITGPYFDALGFEGPFYFQGRSINWWAAGSTPWKMKDEKAASGDFSLRFQHSGSFSGNYSVFSPYGSLDLPSGDNQITFKVWIDPQTSVDKLDFVLNNPWKSISVDLSGVEKGKWVELSHSFSRNGESDLSFSGGDRLQVILRSGDINSSSVLLYVDDISFDNFNVTPLNSIDAVDFSVFPNPARSQLTVSSADNGKIRIFNSAGVLIKSVEKKNMEKQINLTGWETGIYFVEFSAPKGKTVRKIIVN